MKISFVATVYNEEKTIGKLLDSLFKQTKMLDEIIIVDGASTDRTLSIISNYCKSHSIVITEIGDSGQDGYQTVTRQARMTMKRKVKIIIKKGNRAVGRNEAIRNATGDIIVCSDAGCILDKHWVKNITEPFMDSRFRGNDKGGKKVDVVAGYYKGTAKNVFQKCLIPYVLVMPDKVDPDNFLPASRSMAFRKSIWKKIGGFSERLSHNEDYAFARKLKEINANIVFKKDAIVYWIPRENIKEAFIMFFRFALGDAESGIIRPKVVLIFVRYLIGSGLVISFFVLKLPLIINSLFIILVLYIAWSILKNYKYVNHWKAFFILPTLQLLSDIAILLGMIIGYFSK